MPTTATAPSSASTPRIVASTSESTWLMVTFRCAASTTACPVARLVVSAAVKEIARASRPMALADDSLRHSAERRAMSHGPPSRASGADHSRSSPGMSAGASSTTRTASRRDARIAWPPPVGHPSIFLPGGARKARSSCPADASAHSPARIRRPTPMRRRPPGAASRTASTAGVLTAARAGPTAPRTATATTTTTVSRSVVGVWATSMRPMRAAARRVSTEAKGWAATCPSRIPGTQATRPSTATVARTAASTWRGRAPASLHRAQLVHSACTQDCPTTATTGTVTIAV